MIRRMLTILCSVTGVLLLVAAWHLRDPESPQSVIVVDRVNDQSTLFQASLGNTKHWRKLAPPFEAAVAKGGDVQESDSFYFWTYNGKVSPFGWNMFDFTLYQMNNDGGNLHQVETEAQFGPSPAPCCQDSISLPSAWSLTTYGNRIMYMNLSSSRPELTLPPEISNTTIFSMGSSAADERLYFVSGDSNRADLYAYQFEEGQFEKLTANRANGFPFEEKRKLVNGLPATHWPFILIDNNKIAFYMDGSLLNIETGQVIPIVFDFQSSHSLGGWEWWWRSDPRLLIGHSLDGHVVAIRVEDGAVVWSLENVQDLVIGPATGWLFGHLFDGSFSVIRPDGTQSSVIAPIADLDSIVGWSEHYIIYKTRTSRQDSFGRQRDDEKLWRMNPDGSNRVLLAEGLFNMYFIGLSPNEEWLLFSAQSPRQSRTDLWGVRIEDSVMQRVGPSTRGELQFLAWGSLLPKDYTYSIVSSILGLVLLFVPLVRIGIARFRRSDSIMRTPELSTRSQIN